MKGKAKTFAIILFVLILFSACGRKSSNFKGGPAGLSADTGWKQAMGLTEDKRIPVTRISINPSANFGRGEVSPREFALYSDLSSPITRDLPEFNPGLPVPTNNHSKLDRRMLTALTATSISDRGSSPSTKIPQRMIHPVPQTPSLRATLNEVTPLPGSLFGATTRQSILTLTGPSPDRAITSLNILYDPTRYNPVGLRSDLVGEKGYQMFYLFKLKEPEGGQGMIPVALITRALADGFSSERQSGDIKIIQITFEHRPAENLKLISKAPTADTGNSITLNASTTSLSWNEARWGDWNNDGSITAQDVSPLALKFGMVTDPLSPDYWLYAQYVDGNNNGQVGAADISPVALHFGESTGGYNVYQADDASGTNSSLFTSVTRPSPASDPNNPPFGISLATNSYTYTGTAPDPPIVANKFYRVVPFDRSTPPEESTGVASSWTQATIPGQAPAANLSAIPTSGIVPLTVDFDATGSTDADGTIVSYDFDFNGDGTYDVTNDTTGLRQFTYNTPGTYTATVRVTDNDGLTDQDGVIINVTANTPPNALLIANPTTGVMPLDVAFDGTGSSDPDPGDSITLYEFDFTDDTTWDVTNNTGLTNFIYTPDGTYTARLRVTDENSATGDTTAVITVTPPVTQRPIAVAGASPTSGSAPLTVIFTSIGSTDPDGTIVLYEWDFDGDGTYDWSNAMSGDTSFIYNANGLYNATLQVTDNDGLSATDTIVIGVGFQAPTAVALGMPTSGPAPLTVTFSATGSNDPDGTIVLYEWDFQTDGTVDYSDPGTGDTQFIYTTQGTYTATLTVTDNDGLTGTDTVLINVQPGAGQWVLDTVDASGNYWPSLAIDGNDRPAIAYAELDQGAYLATFDGTTWNTQQVDPTSQTGVTPGLAFDGNGNPGISYASLSAFDLIYARWTGSMWDIQTVDSIGNVGVWTSLAFDGAGNPAISYCEYNAGGTAPQALKFAQWTGTMWNIQTVDPGPDVGIWTNLRFSGGNPVIAYCMILLDANNNITDTDLKLATWTGTMWDIQTVVSAGNVGQTPSLAMDSAGNPAISYYDADNSDLWLARWDGSSWNFETVDNDLGDVGTFTSLEFDSSGNPAISYSLQEVDANGNLTNVDLKYAKWNGSAWNLEVVDGSAGLKGRFTSLGLDSADNAMIAYYDDDNGSLLAARWVP